MTLALPPSLSVPALVVVGAVAGLLATLVMDVPMRALLAEGMTPPFVAAGALTGSDTADAPRRVALAVHYGSGTAAGLTFTALTLLAGTVAPGRVPQVRREWLVSAAVYVASVAALFPALVWLVG
jgi:hypothetical protein